MMWKESYRIGVEQIDEQHRQLFKAVENLLEIIRYDRDNDRKQACIDTIVFLRDYAVRHFGDEERYQQSIQYPGFAEHKETHEKFVGSVLDYEKRMVETDFDMSVVKSFAGFLTAWLIYHVADADQRIVGKLPDDTGKVLKTCGDNFASSVYDVLETMLGLPTHNIRKTEGNDSLFQGEMFVEIELTGDLEGKVVFVYSRDFAQGFVNTFMPYEMKELEEVVCSAMAEVSNIVSGKTVSNLSYNGTVCDMRLPLVSVGPCRLTGDEGFQIETPYGRFQILISVVEQK